MYTLSVKLSTSQTVLTTWYRSSVSVFVFVPGPSLGRVRGISTLSWVVMPKVLDCPLADCKQMQPKVRYGVLFLDICST